MKAADKDQFDSQDKFSAQQSPKGSNGGSEKLPLKDEDARHQDKRDHKEYGNTGYPDQEKAKQVPHAGSDASNEARTKANDDKSENYRNR